MTEPTKKIKQTSEGVEVTYGGSRATVEPGELVKAGEPIFTVSGEGSPRLCALLYQRIAESYGPTPIYDALAAEHARDDAPSPSSRLALLAGGLLVLLAIVLLVLTGFGWN